MTDNRKEKTMMTRDENNVTTLICKTICFDIDSQCPVCGRTRDFRRLEDGRTECGTGQDCNRIMDTDDVCWTCREELS